MKCKHCGEPIVKETRNYRGATGYIHKAGRLWCFTDLWRKAEA